MKFKANRSVSSLIAAGVLLISVMAPLNLAAQSSVYIDHVEGLFPDDSTRIDCRKGVVEFYIGFDNQSGGWITSTDLGFRLYSPGGAAVDASASRWSPDTDWGNLYWE